MNGRVVAAEEEHVARHRRHVVAGFAMLAAGLLPAVGLAQTLPVEKQLPAGLALEAASGAVEACQQQGYRVSATVVDRAGLVRVVLRADGAGPHTLDSSRRKAYTSASMRVRTLQLDERIRSDPASAGIRDIDQLLPLAGGVPISAGNEVVGAIGVGGAPGGDKDEACALAGIDKIKDRLK
jgi:uncharacterized protein GlcG (DUF336 family)